MPNGKMDAVQVEDAVMGEKWALSPGFILFGQGLVEAAHRAGTGCYPHQGLSHFPDCMGTGATDKHLRQGFRSLGFIPTIPLKHLRMELPLRGLGALRGPQCALSWSPGLVCKSHCDTLFAQGYFLPTVRRGTAQAPRA